MKSKSWMAFCALLLTSGLVACTTSITESATDVCADLENRESFDAFESTATNLFCDGEFHGGVLIADGAEVLYQDAFGAADLIGTPNSSDARSDVDRAEMLSPLNVVSELGVKRRFSPSNGM